MHLVRIGGGSLFAFVLYGTPAAVVCMEQQQQAAPTHLYCTRMVAQLYCNSVYTAI